MPIILKLVWRNIWRHPRRSVLNIGLVSLGLALIIFFVGFADAIHDLFIETPIKLGTSHFQIHQEGYFKEPQIDKIVTNSDELIDKIKQHPRVKAVTTRVEVPALLSAGKNSLGGQIIGVEPAAEKNISIFHERVVSGNYLEQGDATAAVIGLQLARNLGIGLGDELIILTQDYYGAISAEILNVKGVFETGITEVDTYQVFVPNEMLKNLLVLDGVHKIVVKLDSADYAGEFQSLMQTQINTEGLELMTWQEMLKDLLVAMDIDNAGMYILLIILLIVVAGGLINEVLMNSLERTKEIGVLKAIGVTSSQVRRLIILESLLLGVTGTVIGVVLGGGAVLYLAANPIYFESWSELYAEYGLMDFYITAKLTWVNVVLSSFFMLFISVIAGLVPAYRAGRINIPKALRHS